MNSSGFDVSTIFCGLAMSQLLPALLHHTSVLYRPVQAPMSAPSHMPPRQGVCSMLLFVQSPGRPPGNKVFDLSC